MRKIITIAILFFSYLSFAQSRPIQKLPVVETETLSASSKSADEAGKIENSMLNEGDKTCGNFYKKKGNVITENPLNDIKLTLPNNFNWLLNSIV